MTTAFLLVDAVPGEAEQVGRWLKGLPEVRALHHVHYGHFTWLAELTGASHANVQLFIVNKVRHHRGIEQIREVDAAELPAILASEDRIA